MNYTIVLTEEQKAVLTRELIEVNTRMAVDNPDYINKTEEEYLQSIVESIVNSWRKSQTERDLTAIRTYGEWLLKLPIEERNTFIQELTTAAQQNGIV